jgi:hypothetical protein
MRKLFLQINASVDGFIEDANHEIDWHFSGDEFEQFILDTLLSIRRDGVWAGRFRTAGPVLADRSLQPAGVRQARRDSRADREILAQRGWLLR